MPTTKDTLEDEPQGLGPVLQVPHTQSRPGLWMVQKKKNISTIALSSLLNIRIPDSLLGSLQKCGEVFFPSSREMLHGGGHRDGAGAEGDHGEELGLGAELIKTGGVPSL